MDKYNLLDKDDCGRFAQLLSELTNHKTHFVFSFAMKDEDDKYVNGAITNIEPDSAVKVLKSAARALSDTANDYKELTLRDN